MMSSAFSMPTESDWEKASTWTISSLNELNENLDLYLQISYQGDAARIYADGILVEYNFWNGKPTLVRLSDLIGKHVELKVLQFFLLRVTIFFIKACCIFIFHLAKCL